MKKFLLPVFLCFSICNFSQTINRLSWYKMLAGKIDSYAVTIHLHKARHQFSGYYYYDSQQQPIYFTGEDTVQKGRIKLMSFANPEGTEEFEFSLAGNTAKGTWKKDEKSKALAFTAVETTTPVSFTYIFTSGGVQLRSGMKDSPRALYEAASVWPDKNTVAHDFIKTVIEKSFSKNYSQKEEISSLILKKKKEFFSAYLRQNKQVKEAELKEAWPMYNADVSSKLLIAFQSSKLLTFAFLNYAYTGGAHGNYGTTYTSINLVNSKQLRLQDIINAEGQKELNILLEKYFKLTHNLNLKDSLQKGGLFENTIKPNNNFYVTSKGLCFNYTPYEIGPYVLGEVTIFIPITELKKHLKPAFEDLIK